MSACFFLCLFLPPALPLLLQVVLLLFLLPLVLFLLTPPSPLGAGGRRSPSVRVARCARLAPPPAPRRPEPARTCVWVARLNLGAG